MLSGTTTERALLRLIVHRGFSGNRPTGLSRTLAVSDSTIKSGMLITPKWDASAGIYQWSKGFDVATSGSDTEASVPTFFWAMDDPTDPDVEAAGNLLGLSCLGNYELSTAFVKAGEVFSEGEYLTYDGVTGNMKSAVNGDVVFARVSRDYDAPVNLGSSYTPNGVVLNDAAEAVDDGTTGGEFVAGQTTGAATLTVVRFEPIQPLLMGTGVLDVVTPQGS